MIDWQKKNQEDIEEFLKEKNRNSDNPTGLSKLTIPSYRRLLGHLSNHLKKPFKEATKKDIDDLIDKYRKSPSYYNNHTVLYRDFYRYLFNLDEDDKLPDCVRKLRAKKIIIDKVAYKEKVVTPEEYDLLLKTASKSIEKALLETLWTHGQRKGAVQNILVKDADYDGEFTDLTIRNGTDKTIHTEKASERIRCEYLMRWKESYCPVANNPDAPLFVVHKPNRGKKPIKNVQYDGIDGKKYEQVKRDYVYNMLRRLCKKAGIQTHTPHDFRHSKATRMQNENVPKTHICSLLGWSKNTRMLERYDHNDITDYKKWMREQGGQEPLKPKYEVLEQENKELKQQQEQIDALKKEIQERNANLQDLVKTMVEDSQRAFFQQFPQAKKQGFAQFPEPKKQN